MTDTDYREILRSTRQALDRFGLSKIDERLMSFEKPQKRALEDLIQYRRHLVHEIRESGSNPVDRILERINKYVRTESGAPVQGLRVETEEGEYLYYEGSQFDGRQRLELERLASILEDLIRGIEHENDRDQGWEYDR